MDRVQTQDLDNLCVIHLLMADAVKLVLGCRRTWSGILSNVGLKRLNDQAQE